MKQTAKEFMSSIAVDNMLYDEEITASIAHARMLKQNKLISATRSHVFFTTSSWASAVAAPLPVCSAFPPSAITILPFDSICLLLINQLC